MSGRKIQLKGYRIGKGGHAERDPKRLPVNLRLKEAASKRVRVVKRNMPR
jgi:hypothetical protein